MRGCDEKFHALVCAATYNNNESILREIPCFCVCRTTTMSTNDTFSAQIYANTTSTKWWLLTNPALIRPMIYSRYVPTNKLHKTSQLRMISHDLKIKLGRHRRPVVPREERLCICGSIETENHFLFECHLYYHVRCKYDIRINELSQVLDETFTSDYVNDLFHCRKIFIGT